MPGIPHNIFSVIMNRVSFLIALLSLFCIVTAVQAQEDGSSDQLAEYTRQLTTIESELLQDKHWESRLRDWARLITGAKGLVAGCINDTDSALNKVKEDRNTLGDRVARESAEVGRKRAALEQQISDLEKRLADCRVLALRGDDALARINAMQAALLAEHLLAKGPTLWMLVQENWREPSVWWQSTKRFVGQHSGLDSLSGGLWLALVLLSVVAYGIGRRLRNRLLTWAEQKPDKSSFSGRFTLALAATMARYQVHLVMTLSVALALLLFTYQYSPVPFISVLAYGLPVYYLVVAAIDLFLAPPPPALNFLRFQDENTRGLARSAKIVVMLLFIGYLMFSTLLAQSLPQSALLLARAVFAAVFITHLMAVLWLAGRILDWRRLPWLRGLLHLALLAVLLAEWFGYRNFSWLVLRALMGTLLVVGFAYLVQRLTRELFEGLEEGRRPWHQRLRLMLGVAEQQPVPGLVWVRVLVNLLIMVGTLLLILLIWGLSDAALQKLNQVLVDGFTVGSLHVIPARILMAAVVFGLLLTATGWLRSMLDRRWLAITRMERGAREAVVSIAGYIGGGIAVLVAAGVAGVNFGSLAIIAGALSVGIGFGMQNIVNNFVSGLILLFERPVKTGDWIIVGSTEGYVKRIRIRSTQIQTFDRADVIVPNSELISSQVVNWMLYDSRGRVRVPIGVAYGSDTEQVKALLLQVAREHPSVISDDEESRPKVLFLAFGDSSLNFELRCHIRNIDERTQVISDLNFAIDKAFREHAIEIPFPQRDIHVRSWSPPPAGGASSDS